MNFFVAIAIGLVQTVTAVVGSYVASKKFTYKQKRPFFWAFIALAAVGLGLTIWQAVLIKRTSEDATRNAMGDADHPPFIALISLPGTHRFVVTNESNYPCYGVRIRMFDDTAKDVPAQIVRDWNYSEMGAHQALMDDQLWIPPDDAPQRHFTATISSRTGIVTEELILRKAGNDQWMRASRVMQGMHLLETDIDSAWPRNSGGGVDWNR
jgi:hypothetical protein